MRRDTRKLVATRSHKPMQIHAFGKDSDDVMPWGSVGYELKAGKKAVSEWGARGHFETEAGRVKMTRMKCSW